MGNIHLLHEGAEGKLRAKKIIFPTPRRDMFDIPQALLAAEGQKKNIKQMGKLIEPPSIYNILVNYK